MAKFVIEFDLEAITPVRASEDSYERDFEIARILTGIPTQLNDGVTEASIRDGNGNTIGRWKITD
jgi:hypothetical protein